MAAEALNRAYGHEIKDLDVLIVDDSASMLRLLTTVLRGFGIQRLRQSENGEEALAEIDLFVPDLVISDWEMQPMNGLVFLKELRRIDNMPACFIPVIMLTAHANPALVRDALAEGATQFLTKPVEPGKLLQRIEWITQDDRPFRQEGAVVAQRGPKSGVPIEVPATDTAEAPAGKRAETWMLD